MTRQALAERLEERAYGDDLNAQDEALLREAAEWLRRGCETCQHNDGGDCVLTLFVEVTDQGTRFEHWTLCETLGNGCHAWEARR